MLFLDYVRMLKAHKGRRVGDAHRRGPARTSTSSIDKTAGTRWPAFERMGNAILRFVAGDQLLPVQLWGRFSAAQLRAAYPMLLAPGDPVETLNRFRVLRADILRLRGAERARCSTTARRRSSIHYYMGMPAEEAASYQTLGFFEGLLELAGAKDIRGDVPREVVGRATAHDSLDLSGASPESRPDR